VGEPRIIDDLDCPGRGRGPRSADPSCGGEAVEEDEPSHIVDEVDHADLHRRPGDADRADEEVHFVLLHGEDVLDLGSDFRFQGVGLPRRLWHGAARRFLAMERLTKPFFARKSSLAFER
jgi:hypothetical protein